MEDVEPGIRATGPAGETEGFLGAEGIRMVGATGCGADGAVAVGVGLGARGAGGAGG